MEPYTALKAHHMFHGHVRVLGGKRSATLRSDSVTAYRGRCLWCPARDLPGVDDPAVLVEDVEFLFGEVDDDLPPRARRNRHGNWFKRFRYCGFRDASRWVLWCGLDRLIARSVCDGPFLGRRCLCADLTVPRRRGEKECGEKDGRDQLSAIPGVAHIGNGANLSGYSIRQLALRGRGAACRP